MQGKNSGDVPRLDQEGKRLCNLSHLGQSYDNSESWNELDSLCTLDFETKLKPKSEIIIVGC